MRPFVGIVLFLVFFNGGHVMFQEAGVYETLEIEPHVGDTDHLDEASNEAGEVDAGSGVGSTLFGMYNALSRTLEAIFNAVYPGAAMLKNIGWPDWLVNYLFSGMTIIGGIDMIAFFRRGDL